MRKIRVLVIDDSALVRSLLTEIIDREDDLECVGTAGDPLIARGMIRELNPDVITLDVEMPRMDGLDFLARLMRLRPTPVVMISALTDHGAEVTLRALELGAVEFVAKPRVDVLGGLDMMAHQIAEKIRIAASAHISRRPSPPPLSPAPKAITPPMLARGALKFGPEALVFIGASTGGTEAIKTILECIPLEFPGIVITQHMPAGFTASFAARLNNACKITVKEAVDGERILPGHAYLAPGGRQFSVRRAERGYVAVVREGDLVNRHRPSVEVLFQSAALEAGKNAYGIMLSGMGADGARAMRAMRDAGSYNFVQDENSCVVFGMPREAIKYGAASEVLPLGEIANALIARVTQDHDRKPKAQP